MKQKEPTPKPAVYNELQEKLLSIEMLRQIQLALARLFNADVTEKTDYDEATLHLLLRIRMGVVRAKDISEQMQMSTSHISRLVDRARSKGLLERRPDPSDRRAQQLTLTEQGVKEIDAYVPHAVSLLDQVITATLSKDEVSQLIEMLQRIETASRQLISEREG